MEFNSIGYFQFENLVQGRIPLLLVMLGNMEIKPWYNSVVGMYLDQVTIRCQASEVEALVKEKNLPPHFAIIILDDNASVSPAVVAKLERAGHLNTYYVKGGFAGLLTEREQEKNG
ncbi:MAG: rhodanese-like domain-containing protein [Bdellovibrio sp.]